MWYLIGLGILIVAGACYYFRETIGDAKAVIASVLDNHLWS